MNITMIFMVPPLQTGRHRRPVSCMRNGGHKGRAGVAGCQLSGRAPSAALRASVRAPSWSRSTSAATMSFHIPVARSLAVFSPRSVQVSKFAQCRRQAARRIRSGSGPCVLRGKEMSAGGHLGQRAKVGLRAVGAGLMAHLGDHLQHLHVSDQLFVGNCEPPSSHPAAWITTVAPGRASWVRVIGAIAPISVNGVMIDIWPCRAKSISPCAIGISICHGELVLMMV